ncbi:MAG: hypothetical protein NWE93_02765 [Candidatus Bathyarchaeota archaeon]|nr:hypothetical protein [Candidatus Bathyarchaeota archaeon]
MQKLTLERNLLFEGVETASSVKVVDFALRGVQFSQGIQLEITLSGKTSGKIVGQTFSTHYMLMKPDGNVGFDVKSVIFGDGEPIMVKGRADGKIVDSAPTIKVEADLTFQTLSPKMAYLAATHGRLEATYNMASGEYAFKVYSAER